jgi:DnaJ-class molecular chaperone
MDLYIVLGLAHGATEADIKRAYRRLARRFHPDINPGDRVAEARFRQILDAYETLIDPQRRSRYDSGQGFEPRETRPKSGFEGFDFSARGTDYSATFGDLFAEVLSERGGQGMAHERGADLHQELQLSFEEAFSGVDRTVTVTRRETCRACAGTGQTRVSTGPCQVCQGNGAVRSVRGHMVFTRSCTACGGTGEQRPRSCERCAGVGQENRSETVGVRVPRVSRMESGSGYREKAMPASAVDRQETCMCVSTWRHIRHSTATVTTFTLSCRLPFMTPHSEDGWRSRPRKGRRACGSRRAPSRGSGSDCANAERSPAATDDVEISSSKSG